MQLDPTQPFSTQIHALNGDSFEKVVAASLFYSGYNVDRNLIFTLKKETVAEIDLVASLVTPFNEIRIAIECKGANPSFNDIRKFSTVKEFLKGPHYVVDLIIFGSNSTRDEHQNVSEILGIKLLKKEDLSKFVLPILWGTGELRFDRIRWMNRYLCMFHVESYYSKTIIDSIQHIVLKKEFTKYRKYLYSDLWSIKDPIDQLNDAFEKAQIHYHNFTNTIAKQLGTTAKAQVISPVNEIVQAAMFLELKHRLINLNAIARCSILARTQQGRDAISQRTPAIRQALNELCEYNTSPAKFMQFVTSFVFVWGGILLKKDGSYKTELNALANETGISDKTAVHYFKILFLIYNNGDGLFLKYRDKFFMKYIPASFRAIGLKHRQSIFPGFSTQLFPQDKQHLIHLNNATASFGCNAGIKF